MESNARVPAGEVNVAAPRAVIYSPEHKPFTEDEIVVIAGMLADKVMEWRGRYFDDSRYDDDDDDYYRLRNRLAERIEGILRAWQGPYSVDPMPFNLLEEILAATLND